MFFSKLFGVRVEKFFVFFDVAIGKWNGMLFKWKPKKDDTTYGIGWLPLGGYCKIAGMIDESFDTEQMKKAPEPWEFRVNRMAALVDYDWWCTGEFPAGALHLLHDHVYVGRKLL